MAEIWVDLPSNIIYVAGHVNDVVTVFRQDSLNYMRWRANVDAAPDGMYQIDLQIYDEAGNMGTFQRTLEYILPVFVFDRTQEDVNRVLEMRRTGWNGLTEEQRSEWLAGMKGCLNKADLKRIENDIYVIAQLVRFQMQTNRDNIPDIPDSLYFQTLLLNVHRLRDTGYVYSDTPQVPDQPLNTWQKLNDVEHILHDVYEMYNANNSRFPYTGTEIFTGEETGLL